MSLLTSLNVWTSDRGTIVLNAAQIAAILAGSSASPLSNTVEENVAAPATTRAIYGKMNVDYQGTVTVAGGGSLAGVRGEVDVASGTTASDGFYYGAQGKAIVAGTMSEVSATRICGVLGQLDASAGTITSGQLSAVWADMGATAPSGGWDTETFIVRAENTTSQAVEGHLFSYGKATYWAQIDDNNHGSGFVKTAGTGGSSAGNTTHCNAPYVLACYINGAAAYIPFFTSNS